MEGEADDVNTARAHVNHDGDMTASPVPARFADLFEHHAEAVYRCALRLTGRPADAEDVLQTVFLRLIARGGTQEVARQPTAYFRRAAVNASVDVLRRRVVHAESSFDEQAQRDGTEPAVLLKEQLRRALATLSHDDASLFVLRHVEGHSIDELAGMFRLEKNHVSVRLHRIRLRLQTELRR